MTSPRGNLPDRPLPDGLQRLLRDSRDAFVTELSTKLDREAGLAAIIGHEEERDSAHPVTGFDEQAAEPEPSRSARLSLARTRPRRIARIRTRGRPDEQAVTDYRQTRQSTALTETAIQGPLVIISPDRERAARRSRRHITAKLVTSVTVVALLAFGGTITSEKYLRPHNSAISSPAVIAKLTSLDQVDVGEQSYSTSVKITQSVGSIPCFIVCLQMQLHGTGTVDVILNVNALPSSNVDVNSGTASVTVRLPPPQIGPAVLDPDKTYITDSQGIVNSITTDFRNNPNGYQPLYNAAEAQIHAQAEHDPQLLTAAEQSIREIVAQVLGTIGVKHVTITFT